MEDEITITSRLLALSKSLEDAKSDQHLKPEGTKNRAGRIRYTLKKWVANHGIDTTCTELLPLLKEGGFAELASYIEECIRSNSLELLDQLPDQDVEHISNQLQRLSKQEELPYYDCFEEDEIRNNAKVALHTQPGIVVSSVSRNTKLILAASISFTLFGCLTLAGAFFILHVSQRSLQEKLVHTTTPRTNTTTPTTIPQTTAFEVECNPKQFNVDVVKTNFRFNKVTFRVNSSAEGIDFCNSTEVHLLLSGSQVKQLMSFQEISCPENVASIQIHFHDVQSVYEIVHVLKTFCNLHAISFSGGGDGICETNPAKIITTSFSTPSLRYIKWQNFSKCDDMFVSIASKIIAPNLTRLDFSCVSLSQKMLVAIESMILKSNKFTSLHCADANLCPSLHLKNMSNYNVHTERIECDAYQTVSKQER